MFIYNETSCTLEDNMDCCSQSPVAETQQDIADDVVDDKVK